LIVSIICQFLRLCSVEHNRKNWLFSDTPAGADANLKIYFMIETAKADDLDPHKYLAFLLEHRPSNEMSDDELDQLAPWSKLAQKACK
jgi:transposase